MRINIFARRRRFQFISSVFSKIPFQKKRHKTSREDPYFRKHLHFASYKYLNRGDVFERASQVRRKYSNRPIKR